ncbi:MAG: flagellar biosynthetic protein FliO [Holosporales bacterium]|jgi:flagellar biogenesis protein FliO|nr:flagellar biosynthetic protein FliO [Holosporales bacterium]
MSVDLFVRAGVALAVIVLFLIVCVGLVRFLQKQRNKEGRGRYLRVVETLALDPKRRLVLVQCGARLYLLLLGATDVVVDQVDKSATTRAQENSHNAEPHL